MTPLDNTTASKNGSIATMKGLRSAIVNGEEDRVKQLLNDEMLDELQKSYLIDLAETSDNPRIKKLLKDAPVKR